MSRFAVMRCTRGRRESFLLKERINNLIAGSAQFGWGYGDYLADKSFEIVWFEEA